MNPQLEKARASQHYMAWRECKRLCFFQSQEKSFFLTLPFIERGNRLMTFTLPVRHDLPGGYNSTLGKCTRPTAALKSTDQLCRPLVSPRSPSNLSKILGKRLGQSLP